MSEGTRPRGRHHGLLRDLVEDARRLAGRPGRTILGLTGAPGTGKSTLAGAISQALGPALVALAPMDGFHLSNELLLERDARGRKGAIDTFDDAGYAALLRRLREQREPEVVYAPRFDRSLEQSIGSALPITVRVPLVITEGNYLLAGQGAWPLARAVMDEVWFLDLPDEARRQRLVARHLAFGDDPVRARHRALGPDEANAHLIGTTRSEADRVVQAVW